MHLPVHENDPDNPFIDSDQTIAAEVRQLFRAISSYDSKATELCFIDLANSVIAILSKHLRKEDKWDCKDRYLDCLCQPRFQTLVPCVLRIEGTVVWGLRTDPAGDQWADPLEFELWLCQFTGIFKGYRLRFANNLPIEQKLLRIKIDRLVTTDYPNWTTGQSESKWMFEICRGILPVSDSPLIEW